MQYLRQFDVLLLSETRAEYVADCVLPDHSIAFCPASQQGLAGEGIAIAIRKSDAHHVQDWSSDDTSLWVKICFQSRSRPLLVGVCYVPPAGSPNLRQQNLQDRMSKLTANVAAAMLEGDVLLAGDFNARVGTLLEAACAQQRGCTDSTVNAHGKQLLQLCQSTATLLCTGRAPGDEHAALSFKGNHHSPGSRLDHVVASHDLLPHITHCSVNPARPESDHHPIECTLRMPVGPVPVVQCTGQPLSRRHWRSEMQATYCEQLQSEPCLNKLQAAEAFVAQGNVQGAFRAFGEALDLAADSSGMPKKVAGKVARPSAHQPFFDAACASLKRAVHRAKDPAARKTLERKYHSVVRSKRRAYRLARLRDMLDENFSHSRRFWKLLRSKPSELPSALQQVQKWDAFLQTVADCGCPSGCQLPLDAYPEQPLDAAVSLNEPICALEVTAALQKLHNGRAKGMQGIPAEFLRYAKFPPEAGTPPPDNVLVPALVQVLNAAFQEGAVPSAVNGGLVSPVFKRGDPLDTSNYRPVTVTEPVMRLYASILNDRLLQFTETRQLRAETQTGFRPAFSTVHQLFALQILVDDAYAGGNPLYACFLDLKGAYDKVQRPLLWQVLQRLGVHGSMLGAIQSLYRDTGLAMNVAGRCGATVPSQTGLKQGCPLSPTLFGLFVDGLHRFLKLHCPGEGPCLADGTAVPDLGYADDFVLLAKSGQGLQALIDVVAEFCTLMGLEISVPKTKVLVFSKVPVHPFQWTCNGAVVELVSKFKYLGLTFDAQQGIGGTFPHLQKNMWAAWAMLKRQYGRLQCLSSVGLLFRLYTACVPPTACYGAEVWGPYPFPGVVTAARQGLAKIHLQILRELSGVRGSVSNAILLTELESRALPDLWMIRAAKFWNSLAALPPCHLYKRIAMHACHSAVTSSVRNWAWSMFRKVRDLGYDMNIRIDAMDILDVSRIQQLIDRQHQAVWQDLDYCPRTCPSTKSRLCTYQAWFARLSGRSGPSIVSLPLSVRCLQRFIRFRTGCHGLPRDTGSWARTPRSTRLCQLCSLGALGDEKHMVFECPALASLRTTYQHLFVCAPTMRQFMWQRDIVGVAKFIDSCLETVYAAGSSSESQASDQP